MEMKQPDRPEVASGLLSRVLLPRRRSDILSRPRLLEFLRQHRDRRLLLVSAPAGYGKTTLLVDFAHQSGLPVCWYSLTSADADPRVFFEGLVASVRQRNGAFGERTLRYLRSSGALDLDVAVDLFIKDLYNRSEDDLLLVLDDVHAVDSEPAIQTILNALIPNLPPDCSCVLASRTIPRVRFSRLVANREAAGIGAADLRFTAPEIKHLFAHHFQLVVPDDLVDEIIRDAEGWIAGIILTSHILWQGLMKGMIQAHREGALFDYLAAEVFDAQEASLRSFLLGTSVLTRLSAETCDALLNRSDSAEMLARLDEANLFLSRLDGPMDWYRYHGLFAEFLRERLRTENVEELSRLERRAAELAEAAGDVDDAMTHYLRGGDATGAVDLVEEAAAATLAAGQVHTILRWCAQLPPEAVVDRPRLHLARARAAYEARDLGLMRSALDAAWEASVGADRADLIATTRIWRSLALRSEGRFAEAIEECRAGLATAEDLNDAELIALGSKQLGLALGEGGFVADAIPVLDRALARYAQLSDAYNQGIVSHSLGLAWQQGGKLQQAREYLDAAVGHWRRIGNDGMLAMTLVARGYLSHQTGLLEEAAEILDEAQRRARENGYPRIEGYAAQSLGDLARDRGDFSRAVTAYESAIAIADRVGDGRLRVSALEALARGQLYAGNLDGALAAIGRARGLAGERDSAYERGVCETTYGVILVALNQPREALAALTAGVAWLQTSGAAPELARARLHRAALCVRAGEQDQDVDEVSAVLGQLGGPNEPFLAAEATYLAPALRAAEPTGPAWIGLALRHARPPETKEEPGGFAERLRLVGGRVVHSFSLGQSSVEVDGNRLEPADWISPRARDLWFYLLAFGPAQKEQIVEAFWPEMPIETSLNAFHQTLHRLRRSLFPECVARVGQHWQVAPGVSAWRDDREFEDLAGRLRSGQVGVASPEGELLVARALDLYRGPYLPHLDADWVLTRRRRLETAFLRLLRAAIDAAEARGGYEELVGLAERYLELDPDDEAIHEALMRAHATAGNPRAALRHYQQYIRQLRDELDVEPPVRLSRLSQQLSRGQ